MKTHIYACYLPGSDNPDYVGSHNAEAPDRSQALRSRYKNARYLGAGCWLRPDGALANVPAVCLQHSAWAQKLVSMTPAERLGVRVAVLATVEEEDRWRAEKEYTRRLQPPYNLSNRQTEAERKAKWAAYHRGYRKTYYATRPEKAAAKREADKLRQRAKRAAAKTAVA